MFGLRNLFFKILRYFLCLTFFVQSISKTLSTFINIYFKKLFKWYISKVISILWEMRVKMGWVDTATSEVSILLLETNSESLQRKEKSE